jgi:hypothetical protein
MAPYEARQLVRYVYVPFFATPFYGTSGSGKRNPPRPQSREHNHSILMQSGPLLVVVTLYLPQYVQCHISITFFHRPGKNYDPRL